MASAQKPRRKTVQFGNFQEVEEQNSQNFDDGDVDKQEFYDRNQQRDMDDSQSQSQDPFNQDRQDQQYGLLQQQHEQEMNSMPQASSKIMKQDNYDMVSESQYSKYDAQGGHKIAMAQTLNLNENYGTRTQEDIE